MSRVLIIDDDEGTREGYGDALRDAGFEVVSTDTGTDGLTALRSDGLFDIILADLRLPDMSALDLLTLLRAHQILTPLVVVTGFGSVGSAVAALKLGAIDYVEKPLLADEVTAVVRSAMMRRSSDIYGAIGREIRRSLAAPALPTAAGPVPDSRIATVIQMIESDLAAAFSIHDLSASVRLSAPRLRHLFRATVGVPLARFRKERRLEAAARLLVSSEERVSEIAYRVGFHGAAEFTKAFHRRYAMSPRGYRQTYRRRPE